MSSELSIGCIILARPSMSNDLGSKGFIGLLVLVTAALFGGLAHYGPWLRREIQVGLDANAAKGSAKPARPFADELSGISAELPETVTAQVCSLGIILKKDTDAMKAALVCPLIADASIAPSEILTGVHGVWALGLKESGDTLTMGNVHDEGAVVHTSIESGKGIEAISGQMRVRRQPHGWRLEAFWTAKDDYDRDRASLDALVKSVKLGRPTPLKVQVGKHHQAAVPPGYELTETDEGIEVSLAKNSHVMFGLATSTGHAGLTKSEQLVDQYLTHSAGLTEATTGLSRAYPTIDSPTGRTWDITARDVEYTVGGQRVRAVITAALTAGLRGPAFLVSVRQAPAEQWAATSYALCAIESTARYFPKGPDADALAIPISHPESTWELLEGWAVGRAMRMQGSPRWREAALPSELRSDKRGGRWAFSPWLAQPDGRYANPEDPLELLAPLTQK